MKTFKYTIAIISLLLVNTTFAAVTVVNGKEVPNEVLDQFFSINSVEGDVAAIIENSNSFVLETGMEVSEDLLAQFLSMNSETDNSLTVAEYIDNQITREGNSIQIKNGKKVSDDLIKEFVDINTNDVFTAEVK